MLLTIIVRYNTVYYQVRGRFVKKFYEHANIKLSSATFVTKSFLFKQSCEVKRFTPFQPEDQSLSHVDRYLLLSAGISIFSQRTKRVRNGVIGKRAVVDCFLYRREERKAFDWRHGKRSSPEGISFTLATSNRTLSANPLKNGFTTCCCRGHLKIPLDIESISEKEGSFSSLRNPTCVLDTL